MSKYFTHFRHSTQFKQHARLKGVDLIDDEFCTLAKPNHSSAKRHTTTGQLVTMATKCIQHINNNFQEKEKWGFSVGDGQQEEGGGWGQAERFLRAELRKPKREGLVMIAYCFLRKLHKPQGKQVRS